MGFLEKRGMINSGFGLPVKVCGGQVELYMAASMEGENTEILVPFFGEIMSEKRKKCIYLHVKKYGMMRYSSYGLLRRVHPFAYIVR